MLITDNALKKTILLFMVILLAIQTPLSARRSRGATVEVTLREGRVVRGELLAVKSDLLLVYNKATDQGASLKLDQVKRVWVIRKSKMIRGMFTGGVAGLLVGALFGSQPDSLGHPVMLTAPVGFLTGMLIGAAAGEDKRYTLYTASPEKRGLILKKLRRFARER